MSPKRHAELASHISNLPEGVTSRTKLVNICKTRWVARIESFETFISLAPALVETFEVISTDNTWNTESRAKAASLLSSITQFEFLMVLVVVEACLGYTKGLTVALQSRSIDICTAYREASVVITVLTDVRQNINQHHSQWFKSAVHISEKIKGSPPSMPRCCGRQTQRQNVPAETPEDYYRRSLTVPFIDYMLSHLEMRFSDLQQKATMALQIIPSVITHLSGTDENYAAGLVDFFKDDLPSPSTLQQELHLWRCKWQNHVGDAPDTPTKCLVHAAESLFPNVHRLLRLVCTFPVTSCECECSVSVLRRLKSYLRSTMGQTRLTGLALLHVYTTVQRLI